MGKILICVKIDEQDKIFLDSFSKRYTVSKADVIRLALKEFEEKHEVRS